MADNASTTGAALAFYCAFSLAPLLIILLTLAGWIVGSTAAYGHLEGQLDALFGPSTTRILLDAIENSQEMQGLTATLISTVTLLIGATTVLAALEGALAQIWKTEGRRTAGVRGWVRRRLLSFGFILTLGFLLLVSLAFSTGLARVRDWVIARHTALVGVITILDFAVSLVLVSALFALIYRYMPARRLPWGVVAAGGIVTALLFDVGRWATGIYLAHSTQPSAFGAAASFAALLLWFYYTAQVFLLGAEFTACLGGTGLSNADEKEQESVA